MLPAEERIDLYLEGELPEDEWDTLQQWLQNPDNQQRFLRRVELHADLRRSLSRQHLQQTAMQEASLPGAKMPGANLSEPAKRRRLWLLFATPLALLLLVSLWIPQPPQELTSPVTSSDTVALARIEKEVNARLRQGVAVWPQASLPPGEYTLDQGLLQLRYAHGVMVYMEAPARFEAVSRSLLVLHEGRLSASVPPAGIGFTVETPDAEVVDFGTEFSVDVASDASEVHVFAGQVRVQPKQMDDPQAHSVDLRTSQAVKVKAAEQTVDIALARDRFIRGFDEPRVVYRRTVRRLQPAAYYPMPIRDRGLVADPPEHSGVVLTGTGSRPPHARGAFTGGSLRVGADSSGRGGRVDTPPSFSSGRFSLVAFVYRAEPGPGTIATNRHAQSGHFGLGVDAQGMLTADVQTPQSVVRCRGERVLPIAQWTHVVLTADGQSLRLFVDGRLTAECACPPLVTCELATLWFGTDAQAEVLWDGRIDEVVLFDRSLSDEEVQRLYASALENLRDL